MSGWEAQMKLVDEASGYNNIVIASECRSVSVVARMNERKK